MNIEDIPINEAKEYIIEKVREKYNVSRSKAIFLISEAINFNVVLEEVLTGISAVMEGKEID